MREATRDELVERIAELEEANRQLRHENDGYFTAAGRAEAKLARVMMFCENEPEHNERLVFAEDIRDIIGDTPKVLAVVEGHYDDGMWWEDCDGNKSLTISADPYDGSTTIITFVLAKEAE